MSAFLLSHLLCAQQKKINPPGGHLCNFIARFAENELSSAIYVILLGHAQDTEKIRISEIKSKPGQRQISKNMQF